MRALLAALALAGCAAAPPPGGLEGPEWRLVELRGEPAPAGATLRFEGGRAAGYGLCNRWFGATTRDGAALRFDAVAAPRRDCPELDTEQRYLATLTDSASWEVADGALTLRDAAGAPLARFAR